MKNTFIFLIVLLLMLSHAGCQRKGIAEESQKTNRLIDEASPYLRQHAYNPVDWYPWGREALEKAKKENKMLIISIGYSACHWCHVMEEESFSDPAVAQIMNEHFINVKVDREQRPDIDMTYMSACQLSSRDECGWPLNAFALSDGRPVWAGSYFPKDKWLMLLDQFVKLQVSDPEKLNQYAEAIDNGIGQQNTILASPEDPELARTSIEEFMSTILPTMDQAHGGQKGSPKFPLPTIYSFFLKYGAINNGDLLNKQVNLTLKKIKDGGIYDHVGGGFSRYTVDDKWRIPHFEKMLYDNAQLLGLYADAYRVYQQPEYLSTVKQTYEFLRSEMKSPQGGYYSSINAMSEGEEGKYYTWRTQELKSILGSDFQQFSQFFDISDMGNWNNTNILYKKEYGLSYQKLNGKERNLINRSLDKLYTVRQSREKPSVDDKVIAGWNGLLLTGLAKAYLATQDAEVLQEAQNLAGFIRYELVNEDGSLQRIYINDKSSISAFLDDYAFVIKGFLDLYQTDFDPTWLQLTEKIINHLENYFFDAKVGMYRYASNQEESPAGRINNYHDNVLPNANGIMARNLFAYGKIMAEDKKISRSKEMLATILPEIKMSQNPAYYANWLQVYSDHLSSPYEVAIVGDNAREINLDLRSQYFGNAVFLGGNTEHSPLLKHKLVEGDTYIYVCQNRICKLPVTSVEEAITLLIKD